MPVITSDAVIKRFRSEVVDLLRGPTEAPDNDALWKEWEVQNYLNAAVAETSRRGQQCVKRFQVLAPAATGPFYKLPGTFAVLDISHAYSMVSKRHLVEMNMAYYTLHDDYHTIITAGYLGRTGDYGDHFSRDFDTSGILLSPKPLKDDIIEFVATVEYYAVPCGAPMPFTEEADIALVILWMKKLAYSKRDADSYYPDLAKSAENDFERKVVERKYESERRRRQPSPVRFSW